MDDCTALVACRAIVPALHKKYVASMVGMFGDCTLNGCRTLDKLHVEGGSIDMEVSSSLAQGLGFRVG